MLREIGLLVVMLTVAGLLYADQVSVKQNGNAQEIVVEQNGMRVVVNQSDPNHSNILVDAPELHTMLTTDTANEDAQSTSNVEINETK